MAIVVDANVAVALVTVDPRSVAVARHLRLRADIDDDFHAPGLFTYEVANSFTRLVASGRLDRRETVGAWDSIEELAIQLHAARNGSRFIEIALQLGRQSAYDAAYIALAQELDAELWTLDGPLARNATSIGYPVRLLDTT